MATVDVCLTAGQSNMSGVGNSTQAPATNASLCWEWRSTPTPHIIQIVEPTSTDNPYKPESGSCVPAFANRYTAASGRPLLVVRAARGGTSLLDANKQLGGNGTWDTTGTLFGASVSRLLAAISDLQAAGHTVGNVFVIWSQGGRDVLGGQNLGAYQAATEALVSRWRTATGIATLQIFMEELSAYTDGDRGNANFQYVRDAQNAACASTEGLEMAFNEGKTFGSRDMMRWDAVHYNQTGYNYMGLKMAEYAADFYGYVVTPQEPTPTTPAPPGQLVIFGAPLPRSFGIGTFVFGVPDTVTSIKIEGVGPGGNGGNGVFGLKGGAPGGGAYSLRTVAVTPGELLEVVVTDGGSGQPCTVKRLSSNTIIWRAVAGANGVNGNPNGDGLGGQAADCIGDITISGQNGGVSGIDNGGNGGGPIGGAGAVGPGPNAGKVPGGGGSAAFAGAASLGGKGGAGVATISQA